MDDVLLSKPLPPAPPVIRLHFFLNPAPTDDILCESPKLYSCLNSRNCIEVYQYVDPNISRNGGRAADSNTYGRAADSNTSIVMIQDSTKMEDGKEIPAIVLYPAPTVVKLFKNRLAFTIFEISTFKCSNCQRN